jgi:hypothetical protein
MGEEIHLEFDDALAEAGFAATAFVVEGESAGCVTAHAGGGEVGEHLADFIEDLHVGCEAWSVRFFRWVTGPLPARH